MNILSENALNFITAVQFTKRELQELNNMTFVLDPNWEPGKGNTPTLPLAMFHVKAQTELMETEVSQRQVLFYNSGEEAASTETTTGGQTAVIADNIVIKPKSYRMDIIVPFSAFGLSLLSGSLNQYQVNGVNSFLAERGNGNEVVNNISSIAQQTIRAADVIKDLFEGFAGSTGKEGFGSYLKDVAVNFTSTPDYNKNSLEAMWKNRAILKMKTWNNWQYKYVVIKNLEINKEGTSENAYEGTMTVQEIPILTVRQSAGNKVSGWYSPLIKLAGDSLIDIINGKEGKE